MITKHQVEKEIKAGIDSVLKGQIEHFEHDLGTPDMAARYLENKGWTKGELETNGWDYDWWLPFTKDGKSFTAFGRGYYGGFEFYPTEDTGSPESRYPD